MSAKGLVLKVCQLSLAFLVSACGGSMSRQVFSFGGSAGGGGVSPGFGGSAAGAGISPISLANALDRSEIKSEDCSLGGSVVAGDGAGCGAGDGVGSAGAGAGVASRDVAFGSGRVDTTLSAVLLAGSRPV